MKKYKVKIATVSYETYWQEADSAEEAKTAILDQIGGENKDNRVFSIELDGSIEPEGKRDVHTEHCCLTCGCKYGNENCTVTTSKKKQSFPHEACEGYDPYF